MSDRREEASYFASRMKMTSTSFNVGLTDNTRSSSRVLRPPGGGHTDIFGGEPDALPPTPRRGPPATTEIASVVAPEAPKPMNGNATEAPTKNSNGLATTPQEPAPAPIPAPEPAKQASPVNPEPAKMEPPKRVRVPPGGFSSGLW